MGLLWLTMICGVPNLLIGIEWGNLSLSIGLAIALLSISATIQFGFTCSTSYVSARTGETFMQMSARHFGRKGQHLLSGILFLSNAAWYALNAALLADSVIALSGITTNRKLLVLGLSVAMAFNNVLGFRGVAAFARYVAGPMLVLWVGYTLCQLPALPYQAVAPAPPPSAWLMLGTISSFAIGTASWGNEADFWRHSTPRLPSIALAVGGSIVVGLVLFPLTGWLLATRFPAAGSAEVLNLMIKQTLHGSVWLALLLVGATYFACNDGILYGMIECAGQALPISRGVLLLATIVLSALLSVLLQGYARGLELVTAVSFVFLPAATVIMTYEDLRSLAARRPLFVEVRDYNPAALSGFAVAVAVGLFCSGIFPKLGWLRVGVAPLWGWLAGLGSYVLVRTLLANPGRAGSRSC